MSKKVNLIFVNLSPDQAKVFAEWYSGQGEQNAYEWFENHSVETPLVVKITKDDKENVVIECK